MKKLLPVYGLIALVYTLMAVLLLLFIPELLNWIYDASHNLRSAWVAFTRPSIEPIADHAVGILWGGALLFSFLLWPVNPVERKCLYLIWIVKVFTCLVLMLFYENHYELDAYGYFHNAIMGMGMDDFRSDSVATDFIHRVISFHKTYFFSSYHAIKLSFAYVGLVGIFIFYHAFKSQVGPLLLLLLGFFPSLLFWSSILGKEPFIFFCIAITVWSMVRFIESEHILYLPGVAAGLWAISVFRIWTVVVLLLPFILVILFYCRSWWFRGISVVIAFKGYEKLALFVKKLGAKEIYKLISITQNNFAVGRSALPKFEFFDLESIVKFLPEGIFTTVFRPLGIEVRNIFGYLSGFENIALLVLFLLLLRPSRIKIFSHRLFAFCLFSILVYGIVYLPIGCANFGTSVRFKFQILPLFVTLLVIGHRKSVTARSEVSLGAVLSRPLPTL